MKDSRWTHRVTALGSIGLLALLQSAAAVPTHPGRAVSSYQLPLTFEANQGQADGRVEFLARGPGYDLFLTATEAVFALPRASDPVGRAPVLRMQLVGGAADPRVHGVDALPGKVNYFRGRDSARWHTGVPIYRRVRYSAVYPGIDLVYYGKSRQLEYDFVVAPGADPGAIALGFVGAERTTVDAHGDLLLRTAGGPLRFQKPVIFQMDGERRRTIDGGYVRHGAHEIGFRVGEYDRTRPLIIDPVLSYSTYLGGSGDDISRRIAVDATGSVYVTGRTSSADFPAVNPPPAPIAGVSDLFVAKLTPDGAALVYVTYLSGSDYEMGTDIAVDSAGAAYVAGFTDSADFPTVNALQLEYHGGRDAVFAKLSADGSRLIYSTYLGGRSNDTGYAIAVDIAGAAYIAGGSSSFDFPTVDAIQDINAGCSDVFVAKLAPDGSALRYSTLLGGIYCEDAVDIAVDSVGDAYVTGTTETVGFPRVNPLPSPMDGFHAFVSKLSADGSRIIYSTALGGSGNEYGGAIAVDASGAAYVTGSTDSPDFPTVNALQPRLAGHANAFVVKIAPEGGAMIFGTYLGGPGGVGSGTGIAVDTAGAAYVTGVTSAPDFPTMNAFQPASGGASDAFVLKLAPDGSALVYSTYLGGEGNDYGQGIAVDLAGTAYVTGYTLSHEFPTVNALQPALGGEVCDIDDYDAFVVKITDDSLAIASAARSLAVAPAKSVTSPRSGGGALNVPFLLSLAMFAFASARRRLRSASTR